MTPEQMEKAIQLLIDSHGKFASHIESLQESQQRLLESQKNTNQQISILAENVEAMRLEMHEAFNKLMMINEVTRELAVQIGSLAVQTSQRITMLEEQNGKP